MRESIKLYPFSGAAPPITMADPTGRTILVQPLATYRYYFTRAKTNTFYGHYAAIIRPYKINTSNSAAATVPADVSHQIYAAVQEGVLTAFLW